MVVVAIAALLAVIAVHSLRRHVSSSKSIEALTMIQSIRAAQERYRSLNTVYLDVSVSGAWYPLDPTVPANRGIKTTFFQAPGADAHPDNAAWWQLNPSVAGPVQFGYMTRCGLPGQAMTVPQVETGAVWPATTEPWYVIEAAADADEDGILANYVASSINGEVFRKDEGE